MKEEDVVELKTIKDYVLSRCLGHKEAQRKLEELHSGTCGFYKEVSLYIRLQRVGFYCPTMNREANQIQNQCEACHLAIDREESYVVFTVND